MVRLDDLTRYDTPTVCNAIELFAVRPRHTGYMNASIRATYPDLPPMAGYALTSTFRSQQPPRQGDAYGDLARQVELFGNLPGPAVVVFQDLDQPVAAATFGEVMCTIYSTFGAKGLITSGAGRDLDQVRPLRFPTFTDGRICAHGYCHIPQIQVPVTVGGLTIQPGVLLHGDVNGVTTIPHEIASEVPDVCAELMRAEQIILDYCRSGSPTASGLAEVRKACSAEFERIAQRVRRSP